MDKFLKSLSSLDSATVSIGHFESQGNHPTAEANGSKLSYVDLMKIHHAGDAGRMPPRPVRDVLKYQVSKVPTRVWVSDFKSWIKSPTEGKLNNILISAGKYLQKEEKKIFGNPALLSGTNQNPDPLVDTTALREATAYKTSIDNVVRT